MTAAFCNPYFGPITGKRYELPRDLKALDAEWDEFMPDAPIPAADIDDAPRAKVDPQPVDPERKRRFAEAVQFIREYRGTFGLILDLRADRRFGTKHFRLSDRQVEVVLNARDRDEDYAHAAYERHVAAAKAPVAQPVDVVTEDGMYVHDEVIYKVQVAKNGSGRLYAKRLDVVDGKATFEYAPGAIRMLRASERMTVEQAAAFGHLYGICAVCGRDLTDEDSIAAGIGPVCKGRLVA